jgi:hypothetical protein
MAAAVGVKDFQGGNDAFRTRHALRTPFVTSGATAGHARLQVANESGSPAGQPRRV